MTETQANPETAYRLVLISPDADLASTVTNAFQASKAFELQVIAKPAAEAEDVLRSLEPRILIIDLGSGGPDDLEALGACADALGAPVPTIVIAERCESALVRRMMQLRISDFIVKPVAVADLIRTCVQVLGSAGEAEKVEAEIRTFLPAAGGVGTTTLVLEAASLLNNKGLGDGKGTCVVDLNFQHGSCADYLDIDPQFDVDEIENNPERLDRQLLEVMLSTHDSGLNVIAAPHQPSELRSFKPEVVIRLLDLVSSYFENVVIDMPRIWFPWTETVLRGSDKLYVVADMTVPCIRNAERLVRAIERQVAPEAKPGVIVNRFEQKMFDGGLKRADLDGVLKDSFLGGVSNNYPLVREAVDRGVPLQSVKPNSNISTDLAAILFADQAAEAREKKSFLGFLSKKPKRAA
ncbi:MAG: response regulator receiver protein [Pseudomonadota bacterium]